MARRVGFAILVLGQIGMDQSAEALYVIQVKEPLDPSWSEWLNDFNITRIENEGTRISGTIKDQTALHGLLNKIRDLNLTLICVRRVG
jgi:hypothetical protein